MDFNLDYNYNEAKPHQLESVFDQVSGNTQQFVYNESGSIKQIQDNTQNQEFYWNEEQWLNAVQNDQGIHHYVYDDKGERIMKSSVIQSNVYVNDQVVNTIQDLEPYTLYVNPYFVITEFSNADKVSKHYYMGTQRVASELAVQTTSYSPLVSHSGSSSSARSSTESFKTQTNTGSTLNQGLESALPEESSNPWLNNLNEALSEFGEDQLTLEETQKDLPTIESIYPDLSPTTSYKTTTTTRVIYWYHPDYIGNVDLVSDNSGEAYEFFLYSPWGESLYEWNSGTASFSSPYRFNGKELDQETGLAYYGARYYDNQLSMWLNVDPLAMSERNRTMSPYQFSDNNPINVMDPDGTTGIAIMDNENQTITVKSTMIFYGDEADMATAEAAACEIQNMWNDANAKVTIDGVEYSVNYEIDYGVVSVDKAKEMASGNTDASVNFIRIGTNNKENRSFMLGGNSGHWLVSDKLGTSTTAPHEYGHGLGISEHSDGDQRGSGRAPDIMSARGTQVDPQFRYNPNKEGSTMNPIYRQVYQENVQATFNGVQFDANGRANIGRMSNLILDKNGNVMR
jgi:RHS repeat-associated protein